MGKCRVWVCFLLFDIHAFFDLLRKLLKSVVSICSLKFLAFSIQVLNISCIFSPKALGVLFLDLGLPNLDKFA